jgi:hypothetical protein
MGTSLRTTLARLHTRTRTWTWWQRGLFIVLVPWLALLAWGATWRTGSNRMLAYFASAVVLILWCSAIAQPTSTPTASTGQVASSADAWSEPLLPTVNTTALPTTTSTTRPTTTSEQPATTLRAADAGLTPDDGVTASRPKPTRRAVAPPTTRHRTSPPTTRRRQTTTTSPRQCDSHYPTVCVPPYPPDLDCGQIAYRNFRVLAPDPHGFDGNHDGIGCET